MGPGFFVIAIMGCADGGSQCTPVATAPAVYATEAQCNAATGAALIENQGFDFPTLVAQCRRAAAPASASRDRRKAERLSRG